MAGAAWLAYLPVPGLAYVAAWTAPGDALTRFHARQGGLLVGLLYVGLILFGFLLRASDSTGFQYVFGFLAMLWVLACLVGVGVGMAAATRRRYGRVRPVWDLLVVMKR